jgi:hypothetical protein
MLKINFLAFLSLLIFSCNKIEKNNNIIEKKNDIVQIRYEFHGGLMHESYRGSVVLIKESSNGQLKIQNNFVRNNILKEFIQKINENTSKCDYKYFDNKYGENIDGATQEIVITYAYQQTKRIKYIGGALEDRNMLPIDLHKISCLRNLLQNLHDISGGVFLSERSRIEILSESTFFKPDNKESKLKEIDIYSGTGIDKFIQKIYKNYKLINYSFFGDESKIKKRIIDLASKVNHPDSSEIADFDNNGYPDLLIRGSVCKLNNKTAKESCFYEPIVVMRFEDGKYKIIKITQKPDEIMVPTIETFRGKDYLIKNYDHSLNNPTVFRYENGNFIKFNLQEAIKK